MPFAVAEHDGILTLTLDTPRSAVNIFNHATAQQLVDVFARIDARTTRAVVFETAKPGSFINGVGLLLAHASQSIDAVAAAAALPWAAYRAVRESPVPTVAVVQGNCFGCGVEFALQCDFRLASDSGETRFYMTELADYRFLPLFGSTWNLPATVGLADAVDLLLWGERWDAATALAHGLVDAVAPHDDLVAQRARFVDAVIAGTTVSRRRGPVRWSADEDAIVDAARWRIAALPPVLADVYGAGLDLLVAGARQVGTHLTHQAREQAASAASALSPVGKAAFAFFYLRQMAGERAAGRLPQDATTMRLGAAGGVEAFVGPLRRNPIPHVEWSEDVVDVRFVDGRAASREAEDVTVRLALRSRPPGGVSLYVPALDRGCRLIELSVRDDGGPMLRLPAQASLARVLQRHGYAVARTTPGDAFVTTRLLGGYLAALVPAATDATAARRVNATLREFGFVRLPHAVLAAFASEEMVECLDGEVPGDRAALASGLAHLAGAVEWEAPEMPVLVDVLCLSLLDVVLSLRGGGAVGDAATVDLIARELFDFPLHRTSLCGWLTRARVADAVAAVRRERHPVPESWTRTADAFVVKGRDFYR